jgi:hypothetical protein
MRRSAFTRRASVWVSLMSACRTVIACLISIVRLVGVGFCAEGLSKSEKVRGGEGEIDGPRVYSGEAGGRGVLKETGRLGLGAHQFSESERLRASLRVAAGLRDPREVLLLPRSAGGT